eukprot:COSAG01_NODE_2884_length_6911_cov_55.460804_2_plen_1161_part_00
MAHATMVTLTPIGGGAYTAIQVPYVLGRSARPDALIPASEKTVSRTAAIIAVSADDRRCLVLECTHSAPLVVVRAGRLHEVWQGGERFHLRGSDIIVVQGYFLLKSLGLKTQRDMNPPGHIMTTPSSLHDCCAFTLRIHHHQAPPPAHSASLSSLSPLPHPLLAGSSSPRGNSQPRLTTPATQPPSTPSAAASAAALSELAAQLDSVRGEVVALVLDALVSRVESAAVARADASTATDLIPLEDTAEDMVDDRADEGRADGGSEVVSPPASATSSLPSVPELSARTCAAIMRLAQQRAAELSAAHDGLHPNVALWTESGGGGGGAAAADDRAAARELAIELQAAVNRQMVHIAQVSAAAQASKDTVAAVAAQTANLDREVAACFSEQSDLAKERLSRLQGHLASAREKAAPIFARLKDETEEALAAALERFDEELERPDGNHCDECCDYEPDRYNYSRYGGWRGRYDDWDDEGCPQEDCAGCSCSCWEDSAEHDFSVISSAIDGLLAPIGLPAQPGSDCEEQNWETAISRAKAVDMTLKQWVKNCESPTEHRLFAEACKRCGTAWQTVALWISDEAAAEQGLALDLSIVMAEDDDDERYLPASALPCYRHALHLLQRPWGSARVQALLTTNPAMGAAASDADRVSKDADAESESSEVSALRLQRLFVEGRHAEALCLAKHTKKYTAQLKALTKVGTFADLAARLATVRYKSAKPIEELARYAAAGQAENEHLGSKQQYLLLGTALLLTSERTFDATYRDHQRNTDLNRLSRAFFQASLRLQPSGATNALSFYTSDPTRLMGNSIRHMVQSDDVLAALAASHIISMVGTQPAALHTFAKVGGLSFQETHPREAFVILRQVVTLAPDLSYGRSVAADEQYAIVLLNLAAHKLGDAAMAKTAIDICEKTVKGADQLLALAQHCLAVIHDTMAAMRFSKLAYAARARLTTSTKISELHDLMLSLADDSNDMLSRLITDAKAPVSSAAHQHKVKMAAQEMLLSKLVQHLTHESKPTVLADLCLHRLRAAKTFDASEETLQWAQDAVAAAVKVDRAAVGKAVAQIEACAANSFRTAIPLQKGRIYDMALQFEAGKTQAIDALKKVQPTQNRIFKIAETLVANRTEASRLIRVAEKCSSLVHAAMLQQMQTSFQTLKSTLTCTCSMT